MEIGNKQSLIVHDYLLKLLANVSCWATKDKCMYIVAVVLRLSAGYEARYIAHMI